MHLYYYPMQMEKRLTKASPGETLKSQMQLFTLLRHKHNSLKAPIESTAISVLISSLPPKYWFKAWTACPSIDFAPFDASPASSWSASRAEVPSHLLKCTPFLPHWNSDDALPDVFLRDASLRELHIDCYAYFLDRGVSWAGRSFFAPMAWNLPTAKNWCAPPQCSFLDLESWSLQSGPREICMQGRTRTVRSLHRRQRWMLLAQTNQSCQSWAICGCIHRDGCMWRRLRILPASDSREYWWREILLEKLEAVLANTVFGGIWPGVWMWRWRRALLGASDFGSYLWWSLRREERENGRFCTI